MAFIAHYNRQFEKKIILSSSSVPNPRVSGVVFTLHSALAVGRYPIFMLDVRYKLPGNSLFFY